MSDHRPMECAGIQASINKNFLLNDIPLTPDDDRFSFKLRGNSFIPFYRGNLYDIVDLQGDTSQPPRPGFKCEQEMSTAAGLALVDSKKSLENSSNNSLNHSPHYDVYSFMSPLRT